MSRERKIITIIIGIVVVIVAWVIFQVVSNIGKGTVEMKRAPSNMTFTVDGKKQDNLEFRLSSGEHTLKGTAEGFSEQTKKITVKSGETLKTDMLLNPSDYRGENWLNDHPEEAGLYSAKSSEQFDKDSAIMTEDNPIVLRLPLYGPGWSISYGHSLKYADRDGAIGIYVWGSTPDLRQEALRWIRENGFDPSDMEIIIEKD